MPDNRDIVPARPAQSTTITRLLLHVRHNCSLRHGTEWEDIADGEGSTLAGVDELAGVHALVRDEGLGVEFEAVWVAEGDFGEWCAAARVVDDLFDYAAQVAVAFGIVEGS